MTYKILKKKKKNPLRGCSGNIQNKCEIASTFSTDLKKKNLYSYTLKQLSRHSCCSYNEYYCLAGVDFFF